MQKTSKVSYLKLLLTALCVAFFALCAFVCSPQAVSAAESTLGSEQPYIYFTYQTPDGKDVDGNKLSAGTYKTSIHLTGLKSFSVIQVTGKYDVNKVSVDTNPTHLLSDTVADSESMGYILADGNFVFGFVSTSSNTTPLAEDVVVAEFNATFMEACDAQAYIQASVNPNLTFVQADYADGYDNQYSLVTEYANYTGTLYPMTCDISPSIGYTVSADLVVMTDNRGSTNGIPVVGEYNINIYSDADRTDLVKSVKSVSAEGKNSFVIDSLADGTYYATISGEYAITRDDITIIVNGADIAGYSIPIVACDFDNSAAISAMDAVAIYKAKSLTADNAYLDLDGSGAISAMDAVVVYGCGSGSLSYSPITIDQKQLCISLAYAKG